MKKDLEMNGSTPVVEAGMIGGDQKARMQIDSTFLLEQIMVYDINLLLASSMLTSQPTLKLLYSSKSYRFHSLLMEEEIKVDFSIERRKKCKLSL